MSVWFTATNWYLIYFCMPTELAHNLKETPQSLYIVPWISYITSGFFEFSGVFRPPQSTLGATGDPDHHQRVGLGEGPVDFPGKAWKLNHTKSTIWSKLNIYILIHIYIHRHIYIYIDIYIYISMMYIKLYGKYYADIPWYSCLSWEYGGIFHGDTVIQWVSINQHYDSDLPK
jgi:hypothetical protein